LKVVTIWGYIYKEIVEQFSKIGGNFKNPNNSDYVVMSAYE